MSRGRKLRTDAIVVGNFGQERVVAETPFGPLGPFAVPSSQMPVPAAQPCPRKPGGPSIPRPAAWQAVVLIEFVDLLVGP